MKRYEKQAVPASLRTVLVERCCDLCGRAAKDDEWDAGTYTVSETEILVEVRQKDGSAYPEGGSGTKYEVDLCPKCFKEKLVPWLISQGAKIEKLDWDF